MSSHAWADVDRMAAIGCRKTLEDSVSVRSAGRRELVTLVTIDPLGPDLKIHTQVALQLGWREHMRFRNPPHSKTQLLLDTYAHVPCALIVTG